MKYALALALSLTLALTSCSTPERTAQAGAITDLALDYALASGRITAEQAALAREVKAIVLPPPPEMTLSK